MWEKEKLLITSNFSFFHRVFYPIGEFSAIFTKFEYCRPQSLSVWKSLNFVVWDNKLDVNMYPELADGSPIIKYNSDVLSPHLSGYGSFLVLS